VTTETAVDTDDSSGRYDSGDSSPDFRLRPHLRRRLQGGVNPTTIMFSDCASAVKDS
jgi:hypothetical protein